MEHIRLNIDQKVQFKGI